MGNDQSKMNKFLPDDVKIIDSHGSIIVRTHNQHERKIIALEGSPMCTLGRRLNENARTENIIIKKGIEIQRPYANFSYYSKYTRNEYESIQGQMIFVSNEKTHQGDDSCVYVTPHEVNLLRSMDDKNKKKIEITTSSGSVKSSTEIDIESGEFVQQSCKPPSVHEIDSDIGYTSQGHLSSTESNNKKEKKTFVNIRDEIYYKMPYLTESQRNKMELIDKAAHQHYLCRFTAQENVIEMRPFVREMATRYVDRDKRYIAFKSGLYMIYKLWISSGVSESFMINGINRFLRKRKSMGHSWGVDTLESFIICNIYNEYEAIHPDLESSFKLSEWGNKYMELISTGGKTTNFNTSELISDHERRYNNRIMIIQKTEIQRLWYYYNQKNAIISRIYNPHEEHGRQNPLNNHPDVKLLMEPSHFDKKDKEKEKEEEEEEKEKKGDNNADSHKYYHDRPCYSTTCEKKVLRDTLEVLSASSLRTRKCWDKYMEVVHKILIMTRDITTQVSINKIRSEIGSDKDKLDAYIDFDTNLIVFNGGSASPNPKLLSGEISDLEIIDNEHLKDKTIDKEVLIKTGEESGSDHTLSENDRIKEILHASDNYKPGVLYDPDVPHLPEETHKTLLCYLDMLDNILISAIHSSDPNLNASDPNYYGYFHAPEFHTNNLPPQNLENDEK